jgi:hypothetical protein
MKIQVPYETRGQELGETRQAMTRDVMQKDIEPIIHKLKDHPDKYYILIHAKKVPGNQAVIWKKIIVLFRKPPMMLACMCFGVDNKKGELTIEWTLPGDYPTWDIKADSEPVPEVIASVTESGIRYHYDEAILQ